MPAYRKASIRDLTSAAYALDGRFLEGVLHQDAESGQWMVGKTPLDEWLSRNDGEAVTLIMVSMDDDRPLPKTQCQRCGRQYIGVECPHCRQVRLRLRGR